MNPLYTGVLLAISSIAVHADELTLLDGKKLTNIAVSRVEPDGIVIITDFSIEKVPFSQLSEEMRLKYGYDAKKAADFQHALSLAEGRRAAVARAMQQARATEAAIGKFKLRMIASIRHMFENGGVVDAAVEQEGVRTRYVNVSVPQWRGNTTRPYTALGLIPVEQTYTGVGLTTLPQPVFIYGLPRTYVDGDSWTGDVWPVGTYRYRSESGGIKTVRSFSADKNHAFHLIQRQAADRHDQQQQAL
ncbi:MAG: hypothetical protein M3463_05415 [Verrucomicrobiota bacterium]|nr:hypothetical protein [Verrucomicrobiota bacterium]